MSTHVENKQFVEDVEQNNALLSVFNIMAGKELYAPEIVHNSNIPNKNSTINEADERAEIEGYSRVIDLISDIRKQPGSPLHFMFEILKDQAPQNAVRQQHAARQSTQRNNNMQEPPTLRQIQKAYELYNQPALSHRRRVAEMLFKRQERKVEGRQISM